MAASNPRIQPSLCTLTSLLRGLALRRSRSEWVLVSRASERHSGAAFVESMNDHPRCTPHESVRETEARARKASKIEAYLSESDMEPGAVATMKQPERDAVAQRAGQRSPLDVTWGVVLEQMAAWACQY